MSAGGAAAIAVATLLLGIVIGFFIGRSTQDATSTATASTPLTSPTTTPTSRPPGDTIPQNPVTPTGPGAPGTTAPQVDIAPATIGSIDDPIPVGQAYILGLYEITVLDVDRAATTTLQAAGGPPPPAGSDHLLVRIRVRFTDDGFGRAAAIPFFVSDGTTQWDDITSSCGSVPDSILDAGLIEQGDETVGNACFTVPSELLDTVVFGTEGFAGPVYFALP